MASRTGAIELIPDKLYYVTLRSGLSESAKQAAHFWSADEFSYWNFFLDWGPHSLGNLFRFCRVLNFKLKSERLRDKAIFIYSGPHAYKRANATFLLSAWLLLYGGRSPEQAFAPFQGVFPSLPPFHDASPCVCTFDLTIPHCLSGLLKASRFRFFDFSTFDVEEYEHYEQVEHGDLNWLVDGKFLAFAGPHNRSEMTREGYRTLTPKNYIPYFKKHNVTLVVRLNKKYYDEQLFLDAGIDHLEAYFPDGSVPPQNIVRQFIASCEATPGAIAVHCKAGLGRTGTCIGCYIMKHYGFTAAEVIGWMRICRPGSVIGPQQHYLQRVEGLMHREGEAFRKRTGQSSPWNAREEQRFNQAPGDEALRARGKGTASGGLSGDGARGASRDLESNLHPSGGGYRAPPAARPGGSNRSSISQAPCPFPSPLDASGAGIGKGVASRDQKPSPTQRRSSFEHAGQGYGRTDISGGTSASTRTSASTKPSARTSSWRKSTGFDHSQQQATSLSPFERGNGVERTVFRDPAYLGSKQPANKEKGLQGAAGAAPEGYGRTVPTQRACRIISGTDFRRASVPSGHAAGRSVQARPAAGSPVGKRIASAAAAALTAAMEEAVAPNGAPRSDMREETAPAGATGARRGEWGLGERTQGDLLLQQRARGLRGSSSGR